jgi:hypothetical protein
MHLLLVTVHVCVALEGSRAELAAILVDTGVLSRMLNEAGFLLEFLAALFALELPGGVNEENVTLQLSFLLELLLDALLAALFAWVRSLLFLFVSVHVDCVAELVDEEMTADLALNRGV